MRVKLGGSLRYSDQGPRDVRVNPSHLSGYSLPASPVPQPADDDAARHHENHVKAARRRIVNRQRDNAGKFI